MSVRAHRRAFTLIELLVVVAIIALLISILLPALGRAKEQAKITACVSNLKQIGTAMVMYFGETNDWFPFARYNRPQGAAPLHGFFYGGHPGRYVDDTNPPEWWGWMNGEYKNSPAERPFNRYLYDNLDTTKDTKWWQGRPVFENRRKMPVFQCPSDVGGFWNSETGHDTDDPTHWKPLHWQVGSSYDCNYHFVWNWANKWPDYDEHWLQKANNFLRKQLLGSSAARFVILFEDPFDSAQWNYIPRRGWHKEMNKHSFLFLDGHAANIYADATSGSSGLGWKTAAGNSEGDPLAWWNDPDSEDYRWRDLGP